MMILASFCDDHRRCENNGWKVEGFTGSISAISRSTADTVRSASCSAAFSDDLGGTCSASSDRLVRTRLSGGVGRG